MLNMHLNQLFIRCVYVNNLQLKSVPLELILEEYQKIPAKKDTSAKDTSSQALKEKTRRLVRDSGPRIGGRKVSLTTSSIKEPGEQSVKVGNSYLAEIGSSKERSTPLWEHAQRRFPPHGKTAEEKVAKHIKDLKGSGKIRRRSSESVSVVSSTNPYVQRAIVARKPTNPDFNKSKNKRTQTKAATILPPP